MNIQIISVDSQNHGVVSLINTVVLLNNTVDLALLLLVLKFARRRLEIFFIIIGAFVIHEKENIYL